MGSTESTLQPMEDTTGDDNNTDTATPTTAHSLGRETSSSLTENTTVEDQWWWEIENENLFLDQLPNVSVIFQPNENLNERGIVQQHPQDQDDEEKLGKNGQNTTHEQTKQSLYDFKADLNVKRLARQSAVQDLRDEITTLRSKLATEQELTKKLQRSGGIGACIQEDADKDQLNGACGGEDDEDDDANLMSRGRHANIELANAQLALQLANADNLSVRTELGVVKRQVVTLKEVISCCKQMLSVKEEQCDQLKSKLKEIENSFSEREMCIMSSNLRQEYERQLVNMRQLRQLYEERQRVAAAEHENLQRLISIKRDELLAEQEKTKNFEEHNQMLMKELESVNNELAKMREECNEHQFEKKTLKEEMKAVNTLFSQMVMGFNGKNNLDIDRLTTMLEENRTLLNDIANKEGNCTDGATLPKLLFELVEQASMADTKRLDYSLAVQRKADDHEMEKRDQLKAFEDQKVTIKAASDQMDAQLSPGKPDVKRQQSLQLDNVVPVNETDGDDGSVIVDGSTQIYLDAEVIGKVASAKEIIGNLPKVWKVLMELLSHHKIEQVQFAENGNSEDCYNSVETPNGPTAELSVSKTYIKLKDLILEKKSLLKETSRLKTLNCHLEYRLNKQETRLSAVSLELTKTWHLVGKMQRQHRQLHTQEQILRYQLQQKRRLLCELKDELEYCRRKWAVARAKNDESQEQYNDLRREFAQRKLEDANNSAESGYSDSGPASGGEDDEVVTMATSEPPTSTSSRRKYLKEMFEHTRKIKRMQSTSPSRVEVSATGAPIHDREEIVLRWNSAPPSYADDDVGDLPPRVLFPLNTISLNTGNGSLALSTGSGSISQNSNISEQREERATRIQRLEEQCKTLILQVLETSDNRERLEIQLCRFQDEIVPVQYAEPIDELLKRKRVDRMTRASSAPVTGWLTPREVEYTRKRSERLERLEEESRQLISKIQRTVDRGHYLKCSLDRLRRAPGSYNGSFDSNIEEETLKKECNIKEENDEITEREQRENINEVSISFLSDEEKSYTARRSLRLQRLEDESKQLINRLSHNSHRGDAMSTKLDVLHKKFTRHTDIEAQKTTNIQSSPTTEKRIENIEKILNTRDERLRILEEEGKELISRLTNTSDRGTEMMRNIARREASRQSSRLMGSALQAAPTDSEETLSIASGHDTATTLIPPLSNVAFSSIVGDELTESVTVTTTPSQIAAQNQKDACKSKGAIPKARPLSQLSTSSRLKKVKKFPSKVIKNIGEESLEEMVIRLRDLPFPSDGTKQGDTEIKEHKDNDV